LKSKKSKQFCVYNKRVYKEEITFVIWVKIVEERAREMGRENESDAPC